jgi:hypothetical protein
MDTSELIKRLLGVIDEYQQVNEPVDDNHFRQIEDLTDDDRSECEPANAPNEQYADIESVTTHAGGGVNGPKHAADLRTDSPSLYHYLTQLEHDRGQH